MRRNNEPYITLITGTSRGIGKSLADHYLNNNHIVIGCSRNPIEWQHKNYIHHIADVSDEKAVLSIFKHIKKEFGRLDNLINNAGIASLNHSLLTPMTSVRNVLATNVEGPFLFSREAAKIMQKHKYGRIVNFSTVAVPLRLEGEAIYAASKAAINTITDILAKEFAPFNITVNAVGPSPIKTDLIKNVPQDKIDKLLQSQTLKKYGTIEDIINVIDFFLKEESHNISSQKIYLGGM